VCTAVVLLLEPWLQHVACAQCVYCSGVVTWTLNATRLMCSICVLQWCCYLNPECNTSHVHNMCTAVVLLLEPWMQHVSCAQYVYCSGVVTWTLNAWRYTNGSYWKRYEDFDWNELTRDMIQWPNCDTGSIKGSRSLTSPGEKLRTSYTYWRVEWSECPCIMYSYVKDLDYIII